MQVVLFRDYSCAPEGHTVRQFKAGDTLTGRAAQLALEDGAAFEHENAPLLETKVAPKPKRASSK